MQILVGQTANADVEQCFNDRCVRKCFEISHLSGNICGADVSMTLKLL
jgi:hypothetical protein